MLTVEAALDALDEAARQRSATATNLLITHPRLTQLQPRHADINEIEVDAGRLQSDLVLLGHYHAHARVSDGMWYAGSTDTFSFADDPDRPKGIVVLDTDTGECRHVPLAGLPPAGHAGVDLRARAVPGRAAGAGARAGRRGARRAPWPGSTSRASTPRSTA